MVLRPDAPQAGVFRAVYFLAVAGAAIVVVLTAVFAFYSPPEGESLRITPNRDLQYQNNNNTGLNDQFVDKLKESESKRENYNRNISLILTAISAGAFATAILGLGAHFNPLRAGLTLGALLLFLTGIGFWASGSDKWIGFLMSLIVFCVLLGGSTGLDDGLPLTRRTPARRLDPSEIAPPPPSPPVPPSQTSF